MGDKPIAPVIRGSAGQGIVVCLMVLVNRRETLVGTIRHETHVAGIRIVSLHDITSCGYGWGNVEGFLI